MTPAAPQHPAHKQPPAREREPLFRWRGDRWWPTKRGMRKLYANYRCCLETGVWCADWRRDQEYERIRHQRGEHRDSVELTIALLRADVDRVTALLSWPLRWGARTQMAHGPGQREYDWLALRAERAHITVRAARARMERAYREASRLLREGAG